MVENLEEEKDSQYTGNTQNGDPEVKMKKDVLLKADYRYNFDRDIYFNRKAKKAFSLEFVDDKPEEELVRSVQESTVDSGWTFYFNSPPSEGVKRELERVLG